jgi:CheY-like chemotaxis protein
MARPKLHIVIVEDSVAEITLEEILLRNSGVTDPVTFVPDGRAAIECLQGKGKFSGNGTLPVLLLMDLNMPGMDGLALLKWLAKNEIPKLLGKVVLTSSSDPEQIREAYALGATGVFLKPTGIRQMGNLFSRIYNFWSVAEVPALPRK